MKRFYCTICQRVKRVRQYPADITLQHSDVVFARTGTCARHSSDSAPVLITQKLSNLKAALNIPAKSQQNKRRA